MISKRSLRIGVKLILLTAFVFLGVSLWYGSIEKSMLETIQQKRKQETLQEEQVVREELPMAIDYGVILTRNIFQAVVDEKERLEKKQVVVPEVLVQTSLDLSLEGTISGTSDDARAIITDKRSRRQEMYRIGDTVQGAEIKVIERGKVILLVNGQRQVLTIMEKSDGKTSGSASTTRRSSSFVPPSGPIRKPDFIKPRSPVRIVRPQRPSRLLQPSPIEPESAVEEEIEPPEPEQEVLPEGEVEPETGSEEDLSGEVQPINEVAEEPEKQEDLEESGVINE